MGYKLAGYTVVGNCEIDEDMEAIYKQNHHPKHTYLMDIRDFNRLGTYPDELKELDISCRFFFWMHRQWVCRREEKGCSSLQGEMI